MNINLHIERLVLDGLPATAGHGPAVQAALEFELARLLHQHGLPGVSGFAIPHLVVAPIQTSPGSAPAQWGTQIARSLHQGLAPAPAPSAIRPTRHNPTH